MMMVAMNCGIPTIYQAHSTCFTFTVSLNVNNKMKLKSDTFCVQDHTVRCTTRVKPKGCQTTKPLWVFLLAWDLVSDPQELLTDTVQISLVLTVHSESCPLPHRSGLCLRAPSAARILPPRWRGNSPLQSQSWSTRGRNQWMCTSVPHPRWDNTELHSTAFFRGSLRLSPGW